MTTTIHHRRVTLKGHIRRGELPAGARLVDLDTHLRRQAERQDAAHRRILRARRRIARTLASIERHL